MRPSIWPNEMPSTENWMNESSDLHLRALTFWSPNLICRRAFRLTFMRHKNIRCSPSKLDIGEWWDPDPVVCCGILRLNSACIEPWSCLSMISYTESPWISRSSCERPQRKRKRQKCNSAQSVDGAIQWMQASTNAVSSNQIYAQSSHVHLHYGQTKIINQLNCHNFSVNWMETHRFLSRILWKSYPSRMTNTK